MSKNPFSENVKAEKSLLEFRNHRMDNDKSSCLQDDELELKLKSDEGEKGSALIKSIFHLSYFFIKRGKIKCCHPIFVVTMINFIKTSS